MKKSLISLAFLLSSLFQSTRAQNLVPNGSFENYVQCPHISNKIYFANGWFQPNKYPGGLSVNQSSSSDYYNNCDSTNNVSIPLNWIGYQYAKSGNAYIGLVTYSYLVNGNGYREYAEVKLNQELIASKKYTLKYYVSMANDSRFSLGKFDAYLSSDSLLYSSIDMLNINVNPQFQFNTRVDDTLNWIEITGIYTAIGGERFLTIGNFHDGALCDTVRTQITPQMNCCYAYYYIDDVSLEEDTLTDIQEINRVDFNLYPNPATNKIRLSTAQKITGVKVLNLQTKPVLLLSPSSNQTEIDLDELANGIYLVECEFTSGEKLTKKMVVRH